MLTEATGQVQIDVPRDRDGSFERQIVKKRQRRLTGVDEIILSLYAKGLTTGEISAHFAEIYGASVSKETVSRITDKVLEEMTEWANRPLDQVYAAIFVDAIVVKVRDGQVANRPIYAAIGVSLAGEKDALGLWAGTGGEGAKFWFAVLTDLKNRGVTDTFFQLTLERSLAALEPLRGSSPQQIVDAFARGWRGILERNDCKNACPIMAVSVGAAGNQRLLAQVEAAFSTWQDFLACLLVDADVPGPVADRLSAYLLAAYEGAVLLARAERSLDRFDAIDALGRASALTFVGHPIGTGTTTSEERATLLHRNRTVTENIELAASP